MRYKNYILALIFVLTILFATQCYAYTDTNNHWAENEINNLSLNGIISGYTDGTFRPNKNMTRAELAAVINRLLGNTVQNDRYVPDINVKDWYYTEIRKAIESGFVEGNSNGYIRPNDLITRQEAIVMLQRAFVPLGSNVLINEYEDFESVAKWAKGPFSVFLYKGYIKGYTDGTIKPDKNITRAEVVTIISNIINNFVSYGEYTGNVNGTMIVNKPDIKLKDITINGNLIVSEGAENISLENAHITGDLIIRREFSYASDDFKLDGKKYFINHKATENNTKKYENREYGISFSIPDDAVVEFVEKDNKKTSSKQNNYITLEVNQSDNLYFVTFEDGLKEFVNGINKTINEIDTGFVDYYKYSIYGNDKAKLYYIYLKRDNVEYIITLHNIENINVLDSLVNSITLLNGEKINNHKVVLYKNEDLGLKFRYPDYVAVDDSYNTNVVNDNQDAYYKLFLQVNNIVDMSNYTVEQLKNILVALEDSDGEILESEIKKVYIYDAIEYTVKNDGKLFKSLYIIISNKLYHFVFLSSEEMMSKAGYEVYNNIVTSIEF